MPATTKSISPPTRVPTASPPSRARLLVPLLAAAILAAGAAGAGASETSAAGCESIGRVQTYESWGPALFYDQTVTVAYTVSDCSAEYAEDTFSFALQGTATIFAGEEASGEPIDVRGFESEGSWTDREGSGWPPAWWSCEVHDGALRWEIPEVYSFVVGVTEGTWTLEVSPGDVRWTYAAC